VQETGKNCAKKVQRLTKAAKQCDSKNLKVRGGAQIINDNLSALDKTIGG
tara:strand:- start:63487 stop:63636 length:150 start_codon:yes stop_codon:yes gene_type:complete